MAKANKNLVQIKKFAIIGVLNTVIDYAIFYLLVKFTSLDKSLAQAIAMAIAMTNSYLLNRSITFKQEGKINAKEVFRFIVVNLVSMTTSILFIWIFYDLVHIEATANNMLSAMNIPITVAAAEGKLLAKILATPFVLAVNFIGNKFWVFGEK